jgi:hypothetical protein
MAAIDQGDAKINTGTRRARRGCLDHQGHGAQLRLEHRERAPMAITGMLTNRRIAQLTLLSYQGSGRSS